MTERQSSRYSLFTGVAGGAAAWSGVDILLSRISIFPDIRILTLALGAIVGLLLGAIVPMAEGLRQDQPRKTGSSVLIGALIGAGFGAAGMLAGQALLTLIVDAAALPGRPLATLGTALARLPGWMILGAAVGSVSGLRARSFGRMVFGALGGMLGGLIGGAVTEAMAFTTGRFYGRGMGLIVLGVTVALFSDFADRRRARGRLTVLTGPLKGRSFPVNQRNFTISAAPGADMMLPGDKTDPGGAVVRIKHGTVNLETLSGTKAEINGDRVQSGNLRYDDVIKVGGATLIYEAGK